MKMKMKRGRIKKGERERESNNQTILFLHEVIINNKLYTHTYFNKQNNYNKH